MKLPRGFLRKVAAGTASPSEVFLELRTVIPAEARLDPSHPWWTEDGRALLDGLLELGSGKGIHVSAKEAVREALRMGGTVVSRSVAGFPFYRVLSVKDMETALVEQVLAEVVPSMKANPERDRYIPALRRFRELGERRYLHRLMTKHAGKVITAAKEAGVARQTLHKLLALHGQALDLPNSYRRGGQAPKPAAGP